MENEQIKGFFVEDEQTFKKEQVLSLINRCKNFAKLVGKKGLVHIERKNLTGTDQVKLFLITRCLGSELAKLDFHLEIPIEIADVHTTEIAKFLSVSSDNARTRASDLIEEGFAYKPKKGYIRVYSYQISRFLDLLEKGEQKKEKAPSKKASPKQKSNKKETEFPKVNIDQIFKRLSSNLDGVPEKMIKDCILIQEQGGFKFNINFPGASKHSKQTKGILSTAFVISVGMGIQTFSSRQIKDVCFNSNIDVTGLNYAIRELKNGGYISKASKHAQDNIILEKGKDKAKEILKKLCE